MQVDLQMVLEGDKGQYWGSMNNFGQKNIVWAVHTSR